MNAMTFPFYPKHEHGCPHVGHCPHLGGASLGSVVLAANTSDDIQRRLWRQIDGLREDCGKKYDRIVELEKQVEQLKLELRVERQAKFATNEQQAADPVEDMPPPTAAKKKRKRGAPVGHPGWFRPPPTKYDELVEVAAPAKCPACHGDVRVYTHREPYDHLQEDLIANTYRVVLYRHVRARCCRCRRWVNQPGEGEILGAKIGPRARAIASFLRNDIGISLRKVPRAIAELLELSFAPATLLNFENMLARKAQPLADDIAKKLSSSEQAVHADETYWTLDGKRAYFWLHGDQRFVHFQFDTSRAGQVSRDILGEHFAGVLVTDCYSGYHAQQAFAKQKCLAHLARTARDWQKVVLRKSAAERFFTRVKSWVRRGCKLHRERDSLSCKEVAEEDAWLRRELNLLQTTKVDHEKAATLQQRIRKHCHEWTVFLDDPRVPPTNNLAERALRPLVILRKLIFGHRSELSAQRMGTLMSVQETAKRHGRRPIDIFYRLYTRPPNQVLRYLYAGRTA
jgi:transposase